MEGRRGRTLSYDQLERISLVLGQKKSYKALKLLFADDASAVRWLRPRTRTSPFGGGRPLDRMLRGSIDDLYAVRRYLDGWRGGWAVRPEEAPTAGSGAHASSHRPLPLAHNRRVR